MANTYSKEYDELPNLELLDLNDTILFVSTTTIGGSVMLLADYGKKYVDELSFDREKQRIDRSQQLSVRRNVSQSYKCPNCEHRCQPKFAMKHFKVCPNKN